jgi:ABC-type dipeptide/oligopeptide/nickel transport system permease subunit
LRISLFVGLVAVLFAMTLGVVLGLLSGYVGGWVDGLIMRIADIQMTFPSIMVAMLLYGIGKGLIPIGPLPGRPAIIATASVFCTTTGRRRIGLAITISRRRLIVLPRLRSLIILR